MSDDDAEIRRLRWRCRRGMRELDQLMLRYLDQLWAWCMGRERPADPELRRFVDILIELPA